MRSLMLESFLSSKRHALAITPELTIIWTGGSVLILLHLMNMKEELPTTSTYLP